MRVAEQFPDIEPPDNDLSGLSSADGALALAIYRTSVQRWFTLQQLIELHLSKQLRRLEPGMQAALVSGAAQLVFFDRLPAYAVVDESVRVARELVRPQAAGMVNAVLRKIDRMLKGSRKIDGWTPSPSCIPLPGGRALQLNQAVLPEATPLDKHLVVATSMPLRLVREWLQRWGEEETVALCLQSIENPPTTVVVESGFDRGANATLFSPHEREGLVIWSGSNEQLSDFLGGHADRRVQDAASVMAVTSTRGHQPKTILDYCAGKGTKTRQLAIEHPDADIFATDTHPGRRDELRAATQGLANVKVIEPGQAGDQQYDLVLLDVPCTNTGVLGRRPEARYRYTQQAMGELVKLQREIVELASQWVAAGGLLLYSTCSVEPPENRKQADRLVRRGGERLHEHQEMPKGSGGSYTDGSYHALVRL